MRIFKDMELVEQLGSGIPRVLQTYGRECFKFSDNYIRMSFPMEINEETDEVSNTKKDTEKDTENLNRNQLQIIALMKKTPTISAELLAKNIGINLRNIKINIKKLKEAGIVIRIGPAKGGYWGIIEKK
ncbi:MAG: winged helix-turn-helix transcriptional regulator [Saprospiraceae bacterium]|nr:winged helix-turn-helix transcriptional regulator [Saprospiraceae bacterium]HNE66699.1 winged helix-turn-helix transcriptional regulator [Saprospiraceae bacterium]